MGKKEVASGSGAPAAEATVEGHPSDGEDTAVRADAAEDRDLIDTEGGPPGSGRADNGEAASRPGAWPKTPRVAPDSSGTASTDCIKRAGIGSQPATAAAKRAHMFQGG